MADWLERVSTKRGNCHVGYDAGGEEWERWIWSWDANPFWVSASQRVRCDCGSDAFRLEYGTYEVFGICVGCGTRSSVYSG